MEQLIAASTPQDLARRPENEGGRLWRAHWIACALAVTSVLALYWPTFLSMEAIWRRDMTYTHCYLVPVIVGVLLWRMRSDLSACAVRVSFAGMALCALLVPLWAVAAMLHVQFLEQAIVMMLIPGVVWAVLGGAVLRTASFPLGFLAFAVPFGEVLVPGMMEFTAEFTIRALRLFGVPVYANGNAFSLPSGDFEVVKACSGIRYLIASLAIGTLFAWLNYRSWSRRWMFVALSVVVPVVANGLRAFGIVMIAHLSDMKYAVGFDHLVYGWLFFGIVIGLLFWLGSKFAEDDSAPSTAALVAAPIQAPTKLALVCVLLVPILAIGPLSANRWRASLEGAEATFPTRIPANLPGWSGPSSVVLPWRPVFAESGSTVGARYAAPGAVVTLFIRNYSAESEGENELTTATLVHDDQLEWRRNTVQSESPLPSPDIQVHDIIGARGLRYRVWMWYTIDAESVSGSARIKWRQLRAILGKRHAQGSVIAAVAQASDPNAADRALQAFVGASGSRLGLKVGHDGQ